VMRVVIARVERLDGAYGARARSMTDVGGFCVFCVRARR